MSVYNTITLTKTQAATGTTTSYTAASGGIITPGNLFVVKNLYVYSNITSGSGTFFNFGISTTNGGNFSIVGRYVTPLTAMVDLQVVDLSAQVNGLIISPDVFFATEITATAGNLLTFIFSGMILPNTHPYFDTTFNASNTSATPIAVASNTVVPIITLADNTLIKDVFVSNSDETVVSEVGLFVTSAGGANRLLSRKFFLGSGSLLLSGSSNIYVSATGSLALGSIGANDLSLTYNIIGTVVQ